MIWVLSLLSSSLGTVELPHEYMKIQVAEPECCRKDPSNRARGIPWNFLDTHYSKVLSPDRMLTKCRNLHVLGGLGDLAFSHRNVAAQCNNQAHSQ